MTVPPALSQIKNELADYFASTLRLPRQHIVNDVHILELGVDSIMLIEAQRWIKKRFDCAIEVQQFFEELNTIDSLAAFLASSNTNISIRSSIETQPPLPMVEGIPERALPISHSTAVSGLDYDLMRSQLSLLRDVIEAQNRLLTSYKQVGQAGQGQFK